MSFTTRRLLSDSTSQYRIPNSLRFRSNNFSSFSRTPSIDGNRTTWTLSAWVKRGNTSLTSVLFGSSIFLNTSDEYLGFNPSNNELYHYDGSTGVTYSNTSATFRDCSAWYHIVYRYDSSNSTTADRGIWYVNGVRQNNSVNAITLSRSSYINKAVLASIGKNTWNSNPFDGYMAEINFIDGQALDPLAFGYFSSKTGVWTPSRYTGTYGTNGFYLKFTDTSSNTATGIGKDFSGNNNNWTPSNISLTAGTTYDSMIDTPTPYDDGGYGRGNYAVLNPLSRGSTSNYPEFTLSQGNLAFQTNTTSGMGMPANETSATINITGSLKYYFEVILSTIDVSNTGIISIALNSKNSLSLNSISLNIAYGQSSSSGFNYYYTVTTNGSPVYTSVSTITQGSILMFAIDNDSGKVYLGVNGNWYNSGNPSAGTGNVGIISNRNSLKEVSIDIFGRNGNSNIQSGNFNFGQRPFTYTPPTGFKTLCTQNLPTPAIVNPAQFMAATTYAGTGSTQSIANTVNNRSFQPDLVWIKGRSQATDHALYDSVRGAQSDLSSNTALSATNQPNGLTSFGSNGFTIGSLAKLNTNAQTYVAWQWKAGDSTVTNNAGTIASQVDANPTAGFSIVSYTGTGTTGTVGHGLGIAPSMIITKITSSSTLYSWRNWIVYHNKIGATRTLYLDSNSVSFDGIGNAPWNDTEPTSSVFSVANSGGAGVNGNGDSFITYCFAEVDGFSKFGSYTGNGSANGPFVYCGFRPKWLMYKSTTEANSNWQMYDTTRDTFNSVRENASANTTSVVSLDTYVDILSNGFKLRTSSTSHNLNGATYIFAAFGEAPFKYALAR